MFRWMVRSQYLIACAVLCLCLSASGNAIRVALAHSSELVDDTRMTGSFDAGQSPDCAKKPCVALTFDDGPNPVTTPQILDILARQHVHATFFVIGRQVSSNEALLRREFKEGHEIGNHTWSHPDLSTLPADQVESQLMMTQRAIADAGVPQPTLLRPPYGAMNDMVAAYNHLTVVRWNVDPDDWSLKDPAKLDAQLAAHIHPGAIILLHDIYPSTVATLEPFLASFKQQYQFVTVSQLYHLTAGDQGQYFGHRP